MKELIIKKNFLPYLSLIGFAAILFVFDRWLMVGTDNSFYFDMAYLISNGAKFLVDIIDYRIPVFATLISPIYKLGLSDFTNKYIILLFVYSLYTSLLFYTSLVITKSRKKSLLIAILAFLSISSRTFDGARNICMPLFHHTLEFASILILWRLIIFGSDKHSILKIIFSSALSGALFGVTFIGRQVHVLPVVFIVFCVVISIYNRDFANLRRVRFWLLFMFFGVGAAFVAILAFLRFYIPGIDFLSLARIWLIDFPTKVHPFAGSLVGLLKRLMWPLKGTGEFYKSILPIFWFSIVLISVFVGKFMVVTNGLLKNITKMLKKEEPYILLLVLSLFMYILNIWLIGPAVVVRYQAPLFTFFTILLSVALSAIHIRKQRKCCVFILILVLPALFKFMVSEIKSYSKSFGQIQYKLFNHKVSDALKSVITEKEEVVLVLGGQSTVCRIAGYKPFMGFLADVEMFGAEKVCGEKFFKTIIRGLDSVNVAYKLPDYPNLILDDIESESFLFQYIEKYLTSNFEVVHVVEPRNSYPYSYEKGAIVYRRSNIKP